MSKIDGTGEPLYTGLEARLSAEERAARRETKAQDGVPLKAEQDQVSISRKARKGGALQPDPVARLKQEAQAAGARAATGSVQARLSDALGPVNAFTSGLRLSDSYAQETFKNCLPNTLQTTTKLKSDNTTFTITGDIPAMWVRDSCAQINPYVSMAKGNPELQRVISGTILRHAKHFNSNYPDAPFINSWKDDYSPWEYKYEPDGVAYLTRLASNYTKTTGDTSWAHQTGDFDAHRAFNQALDCIEKNTGATGMVKCPHRPSDDETKYPYNIPDNMFLAASLPKLKDMYLTLWNDPVRAKQCDQIEQRIREGIERYGTYNHPTYGKMWAYETDGSGNVNLMDDANVPSLLSAPYLEFCSAKDPVYQNTRRFALSPDNPYYYSGSQGAGVGSPHTPGKRVWPLAITMQALTSDDPQEVQKLLTSLNKLDAGTHYMHEGVNPDNPGEYSRGWFSWANSLYGEMMITKVLGLNYQPGEGTYVKPSLSPQLNQVGLDTPVPYGDISSLKLQASGEGSKILSATINGHPAPIDPQKGVKVTEDPADVVIKTGA